MGLSLSFAKLLIPVLGGEKQRFGLFTGNNRSLIDKFISDGVLDVEFIGSQQRRIYCKNTVNLENYLFSKYGVTSLKDFINLHEKEDAQRSEAVRIASNTKAIATEVFSGFFIQAVGGATGTIAGTPVKLLASKGTHQFIHNWREFRIDSDVAVVVVENYQNFKDCEVLAPLFKIKKLLFIWRYQNSKTIRRWLESIENKYIHFGDFDPKGVQIYISEFRKYLLADRCSFFIPENLNELIAQFGRRELYEDQRVYIDNLNLMEFPEVAHVVTAIKTFRKGLEQEVLIPLPDR